MTAALSDRSSRLLAAAIFVVLGLLAAKAAISIFLVRLNLAQEIGQLSRAYAALHDRRIDVDSLEGDLANLNSSQAIRRLTILADSERSAAAKLQELARKSVRDFHGQLISINEFSQTTKETVAVQVRASMPEDTLLKWASNLETGDPRVEIAELSIVSRRSSVIKKSDIETTAILRVRWKGAEGKAP